MTAMTFSRPIKRCEIVVCIRMLISIWTCVVFYAPFSHMAVLYIKRWCDLLPTTSGVAPARPKYLALVSLRSACMQWSVSHVTRRVFNAGARIRHTHHFSALRSYELKATELRAAPGPAFCKSSQPREQQRTLVCCPESPLKARKHRFEGPILSGVGKLLFKV